MKNFFEKIQKEIGKGIEKVSIKTKETIESTKIKGQIKILEEQKKSAIEELGNIVFMMFLKDNFDMEKIKEKCKNIKELNSQIKEKEEELRQIHLVAQEALGKPRAVSICECGAEIYEGAKFCGKCGKKVETLPNTKSCAHCGSSISPEDNFCPNCGEKIS